MKATNSNFKKLLVAASALGVVAFVGCGDDNTTVNETTGISQLAKGEALPECSESNAGEMLFVADSGKVYFCAENSWQTLNGENGVDGKDGEDGKDGSDGKDGADGKSSVDTLFISSVDTVVVLDTLVGLNGESCSAEALPDSSGYKIVCGEDSVGVVMNGEDGTGCILADDGNGTVSLSCGEDSVALYKALCGTAAYDPADKFCSNGSTYNLCGGEAFAPETQYCSDGAVAAYGTLTDTRDSQTYKTVKIGEQVWMSENLNYAANENSYCYEDDEANCEEYGRLYTWTAALEACPEGWHLPTAAEFTDLIESVGGAAVAGTALKSTSGWEVSFVSTSNGSDDYGFSALAAGIRSAKGSYSWVSGSWNVVATNFWSASEATTGTALSQFLSIEWRAKAELSNGSRDAAFSVRCLQD